MYFFADVRSKNKQFPWWEHKSYSIRMIYFVILANKYSRGIKIFIKSPRSVFFNQLLQYKCTQIYKAFHIINYRPSVMTDKIYFRCRLKVQLILLHVPQFIINTSASRVDTDERCLNMMLSYPVSYLVLQYLNYYSS